MKVLVPWYRYPPWEGDVIGGLSVPLWGLTQEMGRQGIDVAVLVPSEIASEGQTDVGQVQVVRRRFGKLFVKNRPWRTVERRFLDGYDDIVSVNNIAARTLLSAGVRDRVVRQIHTVLRVQPLSFGLALRSRTSERVKLSLLKKRYERQELLLRGTRTICVSRHLFDLAVASHLEAPEHLYRIPLGVDTRLFRPIDCEKEFDLLFVGKFRWVKGLDILLEALTVLARSHVLPIVGIVGKYAPQEREYILSLVPDSVKKQLRFVGSIPNDRMAEVINASRFVVIPSRYETFSMVALESMACGIPVVAFGVGALPELIDPSYGILVERLDSEALARALRDTLVDPDLPIEAHTNGPAKARSYDWKVVTKQFIQVLKENAGDSN